MKEKLMKEAFENVTSRWGSGHRSRAAYKRGFLYEVNLGLPERTFALVIQSDTLNRLNFPSAIVVYAFAGSFQESLLRVRVPQELIAGKKRYYFFIECTKMLNNARFRKCIGRAPEETLRKVVERVRTLIEA